MANRVISQMVEATSQDKEILGYNRECCPNPDMRYHYSILYCGNYPARHTSRMLDL